MYIPIYGSSERTNNFYQMTSASYGDILTYFSEAYKNEDKTIGNIFVIGGDIFFGDMAFTSNNYDISSTDMIYLPPTSACIDRRLVV